MFSFLHVYRIMYRIQLAIAQVVAYSSPKPMNSNRPLTAAQLADALNLPSAATVRDLARKRKIPVMKIGYRTHRFELEKCRAALSKLEVRAL